MINIHERIMAINLPSKGANSKRSKVEKLCYAIQDEAVLEAREKAKYNGWTNYETWLVSLWMSNDEGSYNYWREEAQSMWNEEWTPEYEGQTQEQSFLYRLSESIKETHEEEKPSASCGVYADLINAALSSVNWYEIAEHYVDDVKEAAHA